MVGRTIAHYQILEKLGEGGMGVVYKARDTHLDRFVAIKVLPPEKVVDPGRKARFVQEAKAASALNHPNIVNIHDISSDAGHDFIAMEYVAGKTLDELIPRKGIPLNEAMKIAVQIAEALSRAHAAGIIHRDLKPANIILDEHGLVKVLDFGLAKLTEPAIFGDDTPTRTIQAATAEGVVVGTAAYMAPEQAEGGRADPRSDIFAFGAVLYELLAGRRAFSGLRRDEPPRLVGIPPELARIVRRCLRPEPARRFQYMADLKVALEEVMEEGNSGFQVTGPKASRRPRLIWIVTLILPVVAAAAGWLLSRHFHAVSAEEPLRALPLTSLRGYEEQPSFAPDGTQLAFVWSGQQQDNDDIYVLLPGSEEPQRRTSDHAQDYSPTWSPDGRSIAFLRRVSGTRCWIIIIPSIGGPERKLVQVDPPDPFGEPWPPFLTWSADSRHLAVVDRSSPDAPHAIFSVSLETAEKRRITHPPSGSIGDMNPAVSPDGRRLVFSRMTVYSVSDLWLLEVGQSLEPLGDPQRLTAGMTRARCPAWTDGVGSMAFLAGHTFNPSLWKLDLNRRTPPRRLTLASGRIGTFSISGAKRRLAFSQSSGDVDIWIMDLSRRPDDPAARRPLIHSTAHDRYAKFSPDGRRIAFVSERTGFIELWVCDDSGANAIRLTNFSNPDLWLWIPNWSPDGKHLVVSAETPEFVRAYIIDVDGGALRPLPIRDGIASSWSADGRFIYYSPRNETPSQVWKLPVIGGGPVQVTTGGGAYALESPDGKTLYFTKRWPGISSLWSMPVEGGPEVEVNNYVRSTDFEVQARGIYFLGLITSGPLFYVDPLTRNLREVAWFPNRRTWNFSVSPDNRFVLYGGIDRVHYGSDLMLVENFR